MSTNEEKIDDFKISLLLRAARSILGWSLKDIATLLDVGASTVGKWENNELTLKAATYIKLLKILEKEGVFLELCNESGEVEIRIKPEAIARLAVKPKKREASLNELCDLPDKGGWVRVEKK
jgi:transcriptional regulator with XRE-family HTH domain